MMLLSCICFSMKKICPNPHCAALNSINKDGFYRRKDDSKIIQRYRCRICLKKFSSATFTVTYRQKKRRINAHVFKFLSSGLSMRRSAMLLNVHQKTIARKLTFLAKRSRVMNSKLLQKFHGKIHNVQFDDLITKENSKLKPLSVSVLVDEDRRLILGAEVSQIPAFGHLSRPAIKKYGYRKDKHAEGLDRLFKKAKPLLSEEALVKSDKHKSYPYYVETYLPKAQHITHESERACIAGQGELKKVAYDPLFMINHTCAILRANINRLFRRTWCTTKDPVRLKDHIDLFTFFYNKHLINRILTPI